MKLIAKTLFLYYPFLPEYRPCQIRLSALSRECKLSKVITQTQCKMCQQPFLYFIVVCLIPRLSQYSFLLIHAMGVKRNINLTRLAFAIYSCSHLFFHIKLYQFLQHSNSLQIQGHKIGPPLETA